MEPKSQFSLVLEATDMLIAEVAKAKMIQATEGKDFDLDDYLEKRIQLLQDSIEGAHKTIQINSIHLQATENYQKVVLVNELVHSL